uniref:OSIGBa0148P16.6 protein n=1 Tax=Oryza sativa TaxID=4530 RepID=Q01KZ9_ORYSA|nr:OSIGBa0148P16.6 [Oryza sativa]
MSGMSLAVGPRTSGTDDTAAERGQQQPSTMLGGVMGSLRVIELQLVAFIMVFSASGLVPLIDLAFPVATTLYLLLLSRLSFPPLHSTLPSSSSSSQEIFRGSTWFQAYVVLGTTVGLFLPLAHVLGGFARGDDGAVRSATPHLFLLSCQILTENVVGALGAAFSPPVRALVPLLYTVRRVFVAVDWVYDAWGNRAAAAAPQEAVAWMWFGRYLAVANLVYFSTNLLVFLIPKFLPRAFEKYFRMRDEVYAKTAEDRHAAAATVAAKPVESKKAD